MMIVVLAAAVASYSGNAAAGDFIDTQVTFKFSDINVRENDYRTPTAGFSYTDDPLFNEGLNTEKTGRESEAHLVLYRKVAGFLPRLETEVALVAEYAILSDEVGNTASRPAEDGSYLKVAYNIAEETKTSVAVTAFPFDSERFLLGYTYDLTWGGEATWPKSKINKVNPVPGVKIDFTLGDLYLFAGVKSRPLQVVYERENNIETQYGGLFGGGYDYEEMARLDLCGGVFTKGTNRKDGVLGEKMYQNGVSGRFTFRQGYPLSESVDLRLYANEPQTELRPLMPAITYPGGFTYLFGAEFSYTAQNLQNPDNREASKFLTGLATDVSARLKFEKARLNFDFIRRDLGFLLQSVPGFEPFVALSEKAKIKPEYMLSLGADYGVEENFMAGVLFGFKTPATYQGDPSVPIVVAVKDREDFSAFTSGFTKNKVILPEGESARNIFAAKLIGIYKLSSLLTGRAEVFYLHDPNDTRIDENGVRVFRTGKYTERIGFALIMQAGF